MSARIRKAAPEDLPALLEIYEKARAIMARTGNPRQWGSTNPPRSLLEEDIRRGVLYLHETEAGRPYGAFALLPGADPTYGHIEGGAWGSDAPYCTIHRLASDGSRRGVFAQTLAFCLGVCSHLRIDTHEDNRIMRRLVTAHGFRYCGVIRLANGEPRLAYERI